MNISWADADYAVQALGGKKKVLLELREGGAGGGAGELGDEPPRAHQQQLAGAGQPVRQQTYYIFHPVSQTFEPITIAEFEENEVIEEVVVAEDYSVARPDTLTTSGTPSRSIQSNCA